MTRISKHAAKVLDKLTQGLTAIGDNKTIDNSAGTFMAVHVGVIGMVYGDQPLVRIAHYYEQNGDLMADPEMVFWRGCDGNYYPTYFVNDGTGYEKESVIFEDGQPKRFWPAVQKDQAWFANTWLKNIKLQQGL